MTEQLERNPEVAVQAAEYYRLLGYPPGHELSERAAELEQGARKWYAQHGRPWVFKCVVEDLEVDRSSFTLSGVKFSSPRLRATLENAGAKHAILAAMSAGPELEQEAQEIWRAGKPDEYFFLETYGSAVVEYLTTVTGAQLCAWADGRGLSVLPHYSPGYPEWDIAEQPRLMEILRDRGLPKELEVLDSGALRPKKSQLAVFGLTTRRTEGKHLSELVPCESCSMASCQFRRTPYTGIAAGGRPSPLAGIVPEPARPQYTVNLRALKRWAAERLTLTWCEDGSTIAQFRYDGSTCTNSGYPLKFLYRVKVGTAEQGYPILEQQCFPAPGDTGYTYMCRYREDRDDLMAAIEQEKPLAGRPLVEALAWQRQSSPAGCHCDPESRDHKWGLVLETIHYALTEARNGKS